MLIASSLPRSHAGLYSVCAIAVDFQQSCMAIAIAADCQPAKRKGNQLQTLTGVDRVVNCW
ncbi:MAG: hypothetical protein RBJ76_17060 [Stenomitos frigidus ULC029]